MCKNVKSYDLVLSFVKEGLGIGFINKNDIKTELENGELFEIKTNYSIPSRQVGVAINKKDQDDKYLQEFITFIYSKSNTKITTK